MVDLAGWGGEVVVVLGHFEQCHEVTLQQVIHLWIGYNKSIIKS